MNVAPGGRLGPYELVSRIGAGGMGQVWRARDTRLERNVAVKVLPPEFADSATLRVRFEREAKVISQLNHPHICTLFDVGDSYLVMELLDGESLAARLERGALPLPEVLRYGSQIAEALDRAHKEGIVHRDLKPGNVMLTRSGAKLLDFGLARPVAGFVSADGSTEQKPLTAEGTIVGTFQYMAPEQLEGAAIDARTDIFALGAVLYEMTTGRPPFQGKTRMSLAASILSSEPPPVSRVQPLTPPALEHTIVKCLSKDPDDRWQSARDIAEELKWIASSGTQAAVKRMRRIPRDWVWIVALLAILGIATWLTLRPEPPAASIDAELVAEGNTGLQYLSGPPALSPDGAWLAYAASGPSGQKMLWLRSMERGFTRPVAGTDDGYAPFWSPDSRFLGFTAFGSGALRKVSLAGGEAETIATGVFAGWSWNRDGVILVTRGFAGIGRVPASGGEIQPILEGGDLGAQVGWPFFLPDGNHYLFTAIGGKQSGLWVAALDNSQKPRFVTPSDSLGIYVQPGFLLFSRDRVLRAQRFDPRTLRVSGEALPIAPVQAHDWTPMFTASDSGLLVYQPPGNTQVSELIVRDRKGELLRKVGEPSFYFFPRVSPDGRKVAVDRSDATGNGDIWILDVAGGAASRLSSARLNETTPVWSPRGDELAYTREQGRGTVSTATLIRHKIGGKPVELVTSPRFEYMATSDWSSTGLHLTVDRLRHGVQWDVSLWSLDEKKWIDVASGPRNECCGVFSPDGKWVAYLSEETGRWEVYVQPVPPTGERHQLSSAGGQLVRWTHRGEIFFVAVRNVLQSLTVETSPLFRVTNPRPLFTIDTGVGSPQYDVLPDGNILVNSLVHSQSVPMKLITHWYRRLDQRN